MPDIHHIYGPSAADRHLECLGSILSGESSPAGDSAKEGTAAHALLEMASYGIDPASMLGAKITKDLLDNGDSIPVTQEMIDGVHLFNQAFDDHLRDLGWSGTPDQIYNESHLVFPWSLLPGSDPSNLENYLAGGTSDRSAVSSSVVLVADFKFGSNPVEAYSSQLTEYVALNIGNRLGWAYLNPRNTEVKLPAMRQLVVQPRVRFGDPVKYWDLPADRLFEVYQKLQLQVGRYIAAKTNAPVEGPMFVTGKHCEWCPLMKNHSCPAVLEQSQEAVKLQEHVVLHDPAMQLPGMTNEQRAQWYSIWLDRIDMLDELKKAIKEGANRLSANGTVIPGRKRVYSFSHRRWILETVIKGRKPRKGGEKIEERVLTEKEQEDRQVVRLCKKFNLTKADVTKVSLLSPSQIEGVLKEKNLLDKAAREAIAALTERVITGEKLVPLSDPGEPITNAPEITMKEVAEFAAGQPTQ